MANYGLKKFLLLGQVDQNVFRSRAIPSRAINCKIITLVANIRPIHKKHLRDKRSSFFCSSATEEEYMFYKFDIRTLSNWSLCIRPCGALLVNIGSQGVSVETTSTQPNDTQLKWNTQRTDSQHNGSVVFLSVCCYWLSQINPSCWVLLCWMSLCWVSRRRQGSPVSMYTQDVGNQLGLTNYRAV